MNYSQCPLPRSYAIFRRLQLSQALIHALIQFDPLRLDELLTGPDSNQVDVNEVFAGGYTAVLHLAGSSVQGHQEQARIMVKSLLEFGAQVNFEHPNTLLTPLHLADANNNTEMCSLLLQFGADPDAQAASGMNVMELARLYKCEDVVKVLEDFEVQHNAANA